MKATKSLQARLEALEGRILGTPERAAVHLMVAAMQGDEAAREELKAIGAADPGLLNGLVSIFLEGPMDGGATYDPVLDASL
ncbi:MAG: hypothetical protein ACLQGV_06035 [Bryobacteraceae bacterium]